MSCDELDIPAKSPFEEAKGAMLRVACGKGSSGLGKIATKFIDHFVGGLGFHK